MAEKGIRSIWIDSDTPESLGNKVIKDDVEIATVPNGVQEYKDPDVVVNREYKYVIQSYTATGQSTDEVLGVNLNYYTIVEATGLKPIMTNFRVNEATPTHIHFDTPLGYPDGMTTTGFVINGKTITGVTKVSDTQGYFTVSAPFTYWDNNTIRLGENDDSSHRQSVVYNFTLEYIENKIPEPDANVNKYVSANGTGDGSSEGNASSLSDAFANAVAGETWWMKAGDYGNLLAADHTYSKNTSENSPIKFIGYKNTIGDITTNYYDYGVTMDTSEMPTFSGSGNSGNAIYLNSCSYVVFRNFQLRNYEKAIVAIVNSTDNHHMVFDRINGYEFGNTSSNNGVFMNIESVDGDGKFINNDHCKYINLVGINSTLSNFNLYGDGSNLISGVKAYSDYGTFQAHTDYLLAFNGNNNICTGCKAEYYDTIEDMSVHGIGVRGSVRLENNYNLIEKSTAVNVKEGFYIRNFGCNFNVIKDCDFTRPITTIASVGGIWLWGGVNDNIVERCTVDNAVWALGFRDNEGEDGITDYSIGDRNIVRNCLFKNSTISVHLQASNPGTSFNDNKIENCTFDNCGSFFSNDTDVDIVNFRFTNNMITNQGGVAANANIFYDYNNFFGNSFANPSGTGNKSIDPDYDANYKPQADFSQISVLKLVMNVDDIDKNERESDTTIGYIKSDNE